MNDALDLPAHPEPMTRHPKAPSAGEEIRLHHSLCFACGDDAPVGLRVRVVAGEDFTVTASMKVEPWMQGGPGVIHGGLLAAAFDEVLGTAPLLIGAGVVTAHLEIDFAEPIPLGSTLHFRGEVLAKERRKVYLRATAHLDDPERPVAAAHGIFVTIDVREHFSRYRDTAVKVAR